MAWETRKRGGLYYTRSRRINGRVVREYIGGGIDGALIAKLDAMERDKRVNDAHLWRRERTRLEATDKALADYCQQVNAEVCQALIAAGYHQHKRGEWRRTRGNKDRQE
ncbi:MAG: hypothetical protein ACXWQR_20780 [Ktedonobacterales bacterium]